MTEQQEIQIRKLFQKHCHEESGIYYISSHFRPEHGGSSQLDELVKDIHRLSTIGEK